MAKARRGTRYAGTDAQRELFVELFATPGSDTFLHATEAALGAGYGDKTTLPGRHAAARRAWVLRQDPQVAAAIEKRLGEARAAIRQGALRVAERMRELAIEGDVQAARTFLQWAGELAAKVEVAGKDGGPIVVDFSVDLTRAAE